MTDEYVKQVEVCGLSSHRRGRALLARMQKGEVVRFAFLPKRMESGERLWLRRYVEVPNLWIHHSDGLADRVTLAQITQAANANYSPVEVLLGVEGAFTITRTCFGLATLAKGMITTLEQYEEACVAAAKAPEAHVVRARRAIEKNPRNALVSVGNPAVMKAMAYACSVDNELRRAQVAAETSVLSTGQYL